MKKLFILLCVLFASACSEIVPPGYVGVVLTPAGFEGDTLQPGRHSCWGRDRMILIETKAL